MSDTRSRDYPDPKTHFDDGPAPKLAPNEASQGVKGHNVRFVLTISTLGAIVTVAMAYFLFFAA